ncbi:MAG: UDP-glucose dehydrogenase family protein [Chloroflexota bacterium]
MAVFGETVFINPDWSVPRADGRAGPALSSTCPDGVALDDGIWVGSRMRISVAGLGYVGLVTAAGAAEWGNEVIGYDADPARNAAIGESKPPFHEPGLEEALRRATAAGCFSVAADIDSAVGSADLVFIAVGTHDGDGGWQTDTLRSCLDAVVPAVPDGATIVIRSTLPPAFIDTVASIVRDLRAAAGLGHVPVLLNPEFTKEGTAVRDFLEPDRVVIGRIDDPTGAGVAVLRRFYSRVSSPVLDLEGKDACLAKLGANLFLATKISFANELAELCDQYGGTVDHVVEAMAHDRRIGGQFLRPGVGFGGSCLPHQVTMTIREGHSRGVDTPLLEAVERINHEQRERFVERIRRLAPSGALTGTRVALLGLTFKPDTDDLRDAPSLPIARSLIAHGAIVTAHDPMPTARVRAQALVPGMAVVTEVEDALVGADVVALVTEWRLYRELDWSVVAGLVARRAVVDGRNALPIDALRAAGFATIGFGRPPVGVMETVMADAATAWRERRPRPTRRDRAATEPRRPDDDAVVALADPAG